MASPQNTAAYLSSPQAHPLEIRDAPMPEPKGSEVIVQVKAVAINPADWAIQAKGILLTPERYPFIGGCDAAGVVTAVGPENTRFRVGDRVTTASRGYDFGEDRYNTFQHYMVAAEPLIALLPDNVPFTDGAVLGLGLCTAASAMFETETGIGLDPPKVGAKVHEKGKVVLVWGGASSVGACAILVAKAAGYIVAATASRGNFGLLDDLGVDFKFDYKEDGVEDKIISELKGQGELAGVFDAVIPTPTLMACANITLKLGGNRRVGTVFPPFMPLPEGIPEGIKLCTSHSVLISRSDVGKWIWVDWLADALADGSMKCMPRPKIVGKGLEKLQDAVDLMGKGVSGQKLVVEL